jgi:putative tryptophan/tyrosine transport system substrate-binding protein
MKRREFIAGLGSAVARPVATRAQQLDPLRTIAVLMAYEESDPKAKGWLSEFKRSLKDLGWIDGRNIQMDVRWAAGDVDRMQRFTKEIVEQRPDAILSSSTPWTGAFQRETRTIPIVFVVVADPLGSGFVTSLPRPGGNITGFSFVDGSMAGKLVELLTEIAPGVVRAAIMFNPDAGTFTGQYYLPPFEAAARSLRLEPIVAPVRSASEIEAVIKLLASAPGGGLMVPGDSYLDSHRAPVISLAAQYKLPTVYIPSFWVQDGGLLSYGPDFGDMFRRAAAYVDRILHGTKPAELPVQLPTKFEMALNLKTAKALGLAVPTSILLRADEVIE